MTGTPRPYFRERCVEGHGLYLRTLRCESPGGTVRLRSASSGVSRKGLDCPEPQHAPDVIRPCESGRGAEGCADKSRSGGERGRRGVMSQVCTGARGEGALQKYRGHARKGTPARARVRAVHRAQVAQGAPEVSANARRALPLHVSVELSCAQVFFFGWQTRRPHHKLQEGGCMHAHCCTVCMHAALSPRFLYLFVRMGAS